MARFTSPLRTEEIIPDTLWILLSPLSYESDVAHRHWTVPIGFKTDFSSVPRVPLAYLVAGGVGHAAAVIHDYLYQTHEGANKKLADKVFLEALEVLDIARWRRWAMYTAVRWAGMSSWDSGPDRLAGRVPYEPGKLT